MVKNFITHITEEDYKNLMDDYKSVENKIAEIIEEQKKIMHVQYLIIPFSGGRAFYSRFHNRVTKIKSSKLTNPECLEFGNYDDPIYEYFEILL